MHWYRVALIEKAEERMQPKTEAKLKHMRCCKIGFHVWNSTCYIRYYFLKNIYYLEVNALDQSNWNSLCSHLAILLFSISIKGRQSWDLNFSPFRLYSFFIFFIFKNIDLKDSGFVDLWILDSGFRIQDSGFLQKKIKNKKK